MSDLTALSKLGKQADPAAPEQAPAPPPSLVLYAILLMIALGMVGVSWRFSEADWPGFLVNIATEIIGAVAILILVDRRLRAQEVRLIQHLPGATREILWLWFSRDARHLRNYARVLETQLSLVAKPFYISRPRLEAELLVPIRNRDSGFVLVGSPGTGKTTLLHNLVKHQAVDLIKDPRNVRVPVLVPVRQIREIDDIVRVLTAAIRRFYKLPAHVIERLLREGRTMCVFDGVDESRDPQSWIAALQAFHTRFPRNPLIISSRASIIGDDRFSYLPRLVIPPLSDEELEELLQLRTQFDA